MGTEEMLSIIDALKVAGATHFKCRDFVVRFTRSGKVVKAKAQHALATNAAASNSHVNQADLHAPAYNPENTARAEELLRKIKDPESLIDSIFPDGAGG